MSSKNPMLENLVPQAAARANNRCFIIEAEGIKLRRNKEREREIGERT